MKQLTFGIIGAGNMGAIHAQCFSAEPGVSLRSVFNPSRNKAEKLAERHGATVRENWHELVCDPALDFVVVTSPQSAHAEQIVAAAEAGKHIFCEKPLALTSGELDAVESAVDRAGVRFMVGHQMRFHPVVRAVRNALPEIGPCYSLELEWAFRIEGHEGRCWMTRRQGGFFMELGCHACDLSRFLFGDVVSLQANTLRIDPRRATEDYTRMLLQFRNRAVGDIVVSANYRNRRQGLLKGRVLGVGGCIEFSCYPYGRGFNRAHLFVDGGKDTFVPDRTQRELLVEKGPSTVDVYPGFFDLYNRQARAFVSILRDRRRAIPCSLADGRAAVEMVLGAYRCQELLGSDKNGFPPAELPVSGSSGHPLLQGARGL